MPDKRAGIGNADGWSIIALGLFTLPRADQATCRCCAAFGRLAERGDRIAQGIRLIFEHLSLLAG